MQPTPDIAVNRKAPRDYHILERYEAGMELRGTEVKSIRQGRINISDAFARVEKGQVWLYGCDIQPYDKASHTQHEPRRTRRLLLHKREIDKLTGSSQIKGLALPILRMYWKDQRVKVELGVGKGKDFADQRQDLKAKVEKREALRVVKSFTREDYEVERYNGAMRRTLRAALRLTVARSAFGALMAFLGFSAIAAILWFSGREVLAGRIEFSTISGFLIYAVSIAASLGQLSGLYGQLREAVGAVRRVFEILDTTPTISDAPGACELPATPGAIT